MKTNKNHPDRVIICALVKLQRNTPIMWTPKETEMLMKAVTKFGKNYGKISNILKNKTVAQIRVRLSYMKVRQLNNSKHENSKFAKILKKLPCTVNHVWTDQQKKKYNAALLKYGCSYKDIVKLFPTLT